MVDPETADGLLDGSWERPPPTESEIELVLVFARGHEPDQVSRIISRAIEICIAHKAHVDGVTAALIIAGFGMHPASPPTSAARAGLVSDLLGQLGSSIKVVHAAGRGCYGLFGTDKNFRYTFQFPDFDGALGLLSRTAFGTAQEFKPAGMK